MGSFCVGVDLGQARDFTAIAIVERVGGSPESYHVRHVERPALGTPYPTVIARIAAIVRSPALAGAPTLVVDATGVGRPVVDLFDAAGLRPIAVTITAGATTSTAGADHRVPKRDLCAVLQVLLQGARLKIAAAMPERAALVDELLAFRVKIDGATARDSYGGGGGAHDDLVMALALACYGAREAPACQPVVGVSEAFVDEDEDDRYDWSWVHGPMRSAVASLPRASSMPGVARVTEPPRKLPPYIVR